VETTSAPAGWHPDPTGRFEFRYYNGQRWTADVSLNGQRFIDEVAPVTPGHLTPGHVTPGHVTAGHVTAGQAPRPGWAPAPATHPAKGFALASFWVGLGSFAFGWIPFVFVLGAGGAITAIVFGIIGLRRVRAGSGVGHGYAVAGIVLSLAAFGTATVGFFFTRQVLRELDQFFDVGEHTERVTGCALDDRLVRLDGSITNNDDSTHSYTIFVSYRDGDELLDTDQTVVRSVAPGATASFSTSAFVDAEQVQCTIDSVTGVAPFTATP
jgi:hypothetical protein